MSLLVGYWPSIWSGLSSLFLNTINFLKIQASIPFWVILLTCIVLFYCLVKLLFLIYNKLKSRTLTEIEINLLNLAAEKDGQALSYNDITSTLRIKKLAAEQIVEALYELDYIEVYENSFEGTQIYLTGKGRDFILGNTIIGT